MAFKPLIRHCVKQSRNDNGFTIIEVLIAIVILSIGILAVAKMQISSINSNSNAMKYTEATIAAQNQIESLMARPFDTVITGYATTAEGYSVVWNVTDFMDSDGDSNNDLDLDGDGNNEIKHVNVVVNDPLGKKRVDISFIKAADI
jgi:type IV pilus modification protein PilV